MERLRAKASLTKDARLIKNMAKAILFKCPSKEDLRKSYGFYEKRASFKNEPLELEYFKEAKFRYAGSISDIGTGNHLDHLVIIGYDETITIKVCDNTVFKYDFYKGVIEFAEGEWIQLLEQSYEQLPSMIAKKNEEISNNNYLKSQRKRIVDCSNYMMDCLVNKPSVYSFIKQHLEAKGFSLDNVSIKNETCMNIVYNGENVMVLNIDTSRGWARYNKGFVNGEWVATFAGVIDAVKEKEAKIINTAINSRVEAAIMKLTPDKK